MPARPLCNCTGICAGCSVQGLHIHWKHLLPNPPKYSLKNPIQNMAARLPVINTFDQPSGGCLPCSSHKGYFSCLRMQSSAEHSKVSTSLEQKSCPLHLPASSGPPFSPEGFAPVRSHARAVCSREDALLRRGQRYGIQPSSTRDMKWNPTVGALLGVTERSGKCIPPFSPWCLLLWSGPLQARLQDLLSITNLIKRMYAFYLNSVLEGESRRGSSLSSMS